MAESAVGVRSSERLSKFFSPTSVALVGASESSPWTRWVMANLTGYGGGPAVVPVNPNHPRVFDHPTVPSLRDLNGPVDLAFVLAGSDRVPDILREASAVGVRNAVVLASGYGEVGAEGARQQQELAALATELDITLLGPNTTGFANAPLGVVPWSVALHPPLLTGPVAGIFESGSICRSAYEYAQSRNIGTCLWVAMGNAAVVSTMDVLENVLDRGEARSIVLFLETVREPDRFRALAARALAADIPIVVMKTGRTAAGARASSAHTGALATDDRVFDAVVRQDGLIRVAGIEELVTTAGALGYGRRPTGRRVAVVTSSGGSCSIVADAAADLGLALPSWDLGTRERMAAMLPPAAALTNPLDVTGFGNTVSRSRPTNAEDEIIDIAAGSDGVHAVLGVINASFLADPQVGSDERVTARLEVLGQIVEAGAAPVFLTSPAALSIGAAQRDLLTASTLHLLPGVELGLRALAHACTWGERRHATAGPVSYPDAVVLAPPHGAPQQGAWPEDLAREYLAGYGLPLGAAQLVRNEADAVAAAATLTGPFALKVCSADLPHKSDVGGVLLDVTEAEVGAAFRTIAEVVAQHAPDARIRGQLLAPMAGSGVELLVGVTVDPTFGPVLAVGLGGVFAEQFGDVAVRVLPASRTDVVDMLAELDGAAVLTGARGREPVAFDTLVDAVLAVAAAAQGLGDALVSLEVNPLLASADGAVGLDALIITGPSRKEKTPMTVDTTRIEDALAPLRKGFAADGAGLEVDEATDERVLIRLTMNDATCADCIIPPPTLATIVTDSVRRAFPHVRDVVLIDPRTEEPTP